MTSHLALLIAAYFAVAALVHRLMSRPSDDAGTAFVVLALAVAWPATVACMCCIAVYDLAQRLSARHHHARTRAAFRTAVKMRAGRR